MYRSVYVFLRGDDDGDAWLGPPAPLDGEPRVLDGDCASRVARGRGVVLVGVVTGVVTGCEFWRSGDRAGLLTGLRMGLLTGDLLPPAPGRSRRLGDRDLFEMSTFGFGDDGKTGNSSSKSLCNFLIGTSLSLYVLCVVLSVGV